MLTFHVSLTLLLLTWELIKSTGRIISICQIMYSVYGRKGETLDCILILDSSEVQVTSPAGKSEAKRTHGK